MIYIGSHKKQYIGENTIADNDYMTVTNMIASVEIERTESAHDLAKQTEHHHRIHKE